MGVVHIGRESAAVVIERSGLGDEEIAAGLNGHLLVPYVNAELVSLWREGRYRPSRTLADLLLRLRPVPAALERVS